jgi:hypothetical protein
MQDPEPTWGSLKSPYPGLNGKTLLFCICDNNGKAKAPSKVKASLRGTALYNDYLFERSGLMLERSKCLIEGLDVAARDYNGRYCERSHDFLGAPAQTTALTL